MPRSNRLLLLTAPVFAAAAAVRLWTLDLPFLESYNSLTRQVIGAAIARNFFRNGFNFFYPEIDANGSGVSLFNGEMPFVPYLAALFYKAGGGVQEGAARLVSVIFALLGLWIFHRLAKKLLGPVPAVWATAVAAFSPLAVALSRTLQPEAFMGFASVGFVYFAFRYRQKTRMRDAAWAAFFLFLAVGAKFYNGYLIALTAGWFWGPRLQAPAKRLAASGLVLAGLALALAWSVMMWNAGRHADLFYNPFQFSANRGPADQSYLQVFLTPHYLAGMVKSFSVHLLSPVAALLWAYSFTRKGTGCAEGVGIARQWMFWSGVLMLVIWKTAVDHPYYQYPVLFPAALLAGWGASELWVSLKKWDVLRRGLAVLGIMSHLFLAGYLYRGLYRVPEDRQPILAAAREARERIPKDALVLASHWTNESLLYYCDRRGWILDLVTQSDEQLIRRFDELRAKGARYYVTSTPEDLKRREGFYRHLSAHGTPVSVSDRYSIYQLEA